MKKGIREALKIFNNRPMRGLDKSRYDLFMEIDKPALKPLPKERFKIFSFKFARVNIDYHVEVEKSFYSAPYKLLHKKVDVRYNDHTVQIYYNGNRVASHLRTFLKGKYITDDSHRPPAHLKYLDRLGISIFFMRVFRQCIRQG